jgi:hypothetical protein
MFVEIFFTWPEVLGKAELCTSDIDGPCLLALP